MTARISIIMPCYNAVTHLPQCVGSVLAQTQSDWELIIVDDGSSDASWQEIQRLALTDPRIRVFHQPNSGAAAARNRALLEARGIYIAFLDADDTWCPEFLETMVAAFDNDPSAEIAYCGWQNIGLGKGCNDPFCPPEYENSDKTESLLIGCRWPIHAAMIRNQTMHSIRFDESLTSCMDYDLWLRLGTILRLIRVPRVLAYYHHHGGNQITSNQSLIAFNHLRVQQKFLSENPAVRDMLGKGRIREITDGELLKRGYVNYWKRDLIAARKIFRVVMAHGYGKPKDWQYMLASLLPLPLHRALIRLMDRRSKDKPLPEAGFMNGLVDGMHPPTVSIIIPCYNGASFLHEAINSALGQTHPHKEVIVVNDGSNDESLTIMRSYGPRIKIIDQQNAGLPSARNAGINKGSGDYFAFLDADDYWAPEFLSHMLTALEGRGTAIAYCGWQNIGLSGPSGQPFIPSDYETMSNKLEILATNVRWPVHAALIRREILYEAGLFNPALKSCEDFALWIHAATRHPLVRVPEVLAFYRFHGNQMTNNRSRIALSRYEVQRAYFRENPESALLLGKKKVLTITLGELLKLGYTCYWRRDLPAARIIFRKVMSKGYGRIKDWKYMLPSLLPLPLHQWLIQLRKNKSQTPSPDKSTEP